MFIFHGLGGDAEGMVLGSEYNELVEAERFILIAPDGANDADGEQVFPFFLVQMSGMRKIMTRSVA